MATDRKTWVGSLADAYLWFVLCVLVGFPVIFLILSALFATARGAPVPPPVVPSTPEHMVGAWEYDWGSMAGGRIVLGADGRYVSCHHPRWRTEEVAGGYVRVFEDCVYTHTGRWEWDGRTLVLWEYRITDWWDVHSASRFAIDFGRVAGYRLTGRSSTGVPVVIAKLPND